jgi:hypothetical protein
MACLNARKANAPSSGAASPPSQPRGTLECLRGRPVVCLRLTDHPGPYLVVGYLPLRSSTLPCWWIFSEFWNYDWLAVTMGTLWTMHIVFPVRQFCACCSASLHWLAWYYWIYITDAE